MSDNKPIYKGGWQFGDTIRQELKGPIGDGQVTYPNGDRFKGYFHLSYASINGPAYAAEGRYDFADGSYIERAWINTDSSRTIFDLQGVFRIHRDGGPDSIALFFRNQRHSFELFLADKPYAIEWYHDNRLREVEVNDYDIAEPAKDCLTLTLTLADGTRIVQSGGRYKVNQYDNYIYEPHTDVTVQFPNGDSIDHWGGCLKLLKPYDGYLTLHCAETQMFREERWEQGTCVEAEEWRRDTRAAKKLSLPRPFEKGETDALVWRDGHIEYNFGEWTYDGETKDDCPDGKGVIMGNYSYKGQRYEGEFSMGRANGQGAFENTKAGIRQEGTFVDGVYQESNPAMGTIILHAHHGHSHWSTSSQSDWKYEESDFEAKLGKLSSFSGFGDISIVRIEKDCITLTDYYGNLKELHLGDTIHYTAEIEGREWSDGCVYDGDDYSLDLTWIDIIIMDNPQNYHG